MENNLVRISQQKISILRVTVFAKYFEGVNGNLCFMPNLIQIIIDVGTLGCRPYIHNELCYTLLKEFFKSKPKEKGVRWNKSFSMSNQRPHILNHLKICSLEKILKFATPFMINFVVIFDIIWLKGPWLCQMSCLGQEVIEMLEVTFFILES
jgi:hypothetical protein